MTVSVLDQEIRFPEEKLPTAPEMDVISLVSLESLKTEDAGLLPTARQRVSSFQPHVLSMAVDIRLPQNWFERRRTHLPSCYHVGDVLPA
jgi:hypothetical protein